MIKCPKGVKSTEKRAKLSKEKLTSVSKLLKILLE